MRVEPDDHPLELGRFRFAEVSGSTGGMKIGGGLLRYFTVVFDYPGNRMILEPNRRYQGPQGPAQNP